MSKTYNKDNLIKNMNENVIYSWNGVICNGNETDVAIYAIGYDKKTFIVVNQFSLIKIQESPSNSTLYAVNPKKIKSGTGGIMDITVHSLITPDEMAKKVQSITKLKTLLETPDQLNLTFPTTLDDIKYWRLFMSPSDYGTIEITNGVSGKDDFNYYLTRSINHMNFKQLADILDYYFSLPGANLIIHEIIIQMDVTSLGTGIGINNITLSGGYSANKQIMEIDAMSILDLAKYLNSLISYSALSGEYFENSKERCGVCKVTCKNSCFLFYNLI
jgi:hypothetical protein